MEMSPAERIRALQEKGTINAEQADELLKALEEASPEGDPIPSSEEREAHREDARDFGDYENRRGRRLSRSFLDMDWVDGMVDGITSGLGVKDWDGSWDREGYRHAGQWDANSQRSSRIEQPQGEEFEFHENRMSFSKIEGLKMARSRMKHNSFSASTFRDADLADSSLEKCSLSGASLHELHMEDAELRGVGFAGSKVVRLTLRSHSFIKDTKFLGSTVNGLTLETGSSVDDTFLSGATMTDVTLSEESRIKDCRLSGLTGSHLNLSGTLFANTRLQGCVVSNTTMRDTEIKDSAFRGCKLQDAEISSTRVKDSRFDAIGFHALRIQNSTLRKVTFRGMKERFPRNTERLSIIDTTMEDVLFVDCDLRETVFKGVKLTNLRIQGADLSGRTIERPEELDRWRRS